MKTKKLKLTKLDLITSGLCMLAILPGIVVYNRLPEKVARHFDINGNPDGYSARIVVVIGIPLLVTVIHLLSCIRINMDEKQENAGRLKELIRFITPTLLYVVQAAILMYSLGNGIVDFMSISLVVYSVIFIVVGNYLPKVKPNSAIGIRTGATRSNEEVWYKTHRFGGYLWVVLGVLMLPFAMMKKYPAIVLIFLLMVIVPIIYAEILSGKIKKRGLGGEQNGKN